MNNTYIYRSKISERKFREILRYFCVDLEAKKVAELINISRPTINKIYDQIREKIALECENESPFQNDEIELEESYCNLHIKGCEFRFNNRHENMYKLPLNIIQKNPFKSS